MCLREVLDKNEGKTAIVGLGDFGKKKQKWKGMAE